LGDGDVISGNIDGSILEVGDWAHRDESGKIGFISLDVNWQGCEGGTHCMLEGAVLWFFADFSGENGGWDAALIYFYQYVMWLFRGLKTCHDFGHEKTA
jgi:hypothetical protein